MFGAFSQPPMKRPRPNGDSTWLAPMLGYGFGAAAGALGHPALAGPAGALGMFLGQTFKDITGYGEYHVNKNVLLTGEIPNVSNPPTTNGWVVSHKEYIGDIITSATANTFQMASFDLNPTNAQVWEWLAQVSVNFEEWKPEGIIFYYKSTSGDSLNSVNTALGNVTMATNYNPYNPAFQTKAEMESYEFCTSGLPSTNIMHAVECDPSQGSISTYYTNIGPAMNQLQDKRFNTLGTFYIATSGFQGTSVNIGELWVTYQFTFLKPKLYSSIGMANDWVKWGNTVNYTSTPGFNILGPIGGAATVLLQGMPWTLNVPSQKMWVDTGSPTNNGKVHFPVYPFATQYIVNFFIAQNVAQAAPSITLTTSGGDYAAAYAPTTGAITGIETGAVAKAWLWTFTVQLPGGFLASTTNTPWLNVAIGTTPANNFTAYWTISQIPNSWSIMTAQ